MLRRPLLAGIATLVVSLGAAACASTAGTAAPPPSAVPPTIDAATWPQFNASVLTTSTGFALYVFQPDDRQKATCTGTCAAVWPPVLLASGQSATAGTGVQSSLLGTDPYPGGRTVATYDGWPLYTYVSDTTPGVAAGQGLDLNGGYWYVIRSNGQVIVPPGDPGVSSSSVSVPSSSAAPTIDAAFDSQLKADVLVSSAGYPLYVFQPDQRRSATCTGVCADVWPPVLLSAGQSAVAGSGVSASLLGKDSYSGGKSIVTYGGWPLYSYISDTTPRVATGQGLDLNGGYWYVIQPNGQPIVPAGDPTVP